MPLIKKGIKEILQGKDDNWAGADGNAVLNGLKQTGEAFLGGLANAAIGAAAGALADINPLAKSDNNYEDLGDAGKKGGGILEYSIYRDSETPPTANGSNNYVDLGDPNRKGGGLHEYEDSEAGANDKGSNNYADLGVPGRKGGGLFEYKNSDTSPNARGSSNSVDLGDPNQKGGGVKEYALERALGRFGAGVFRPDGPPRDIQANTPKWLQEKAVWDGYIVEPKVRINSVLEERSYLDFYFPNTSMGSGDGIRRIAFFENAKIREDRSARYASQQIVARNEPVRLFTGAEPRKLKIDFTYTLPHIEYFFRMCNTAALAGFMSNPKTGFDLGDVGDQNQPLRRGNQWDHRRFVKAYLDKFFGTSFSVKTGSTLTFENTDRVTGPRAYEPTYREPKDGYNNSRTSDNENRLLRSISKNDEDLGSDIMMATYYTQFAIDTIRASVVGDKLKKGPVGPPIVRFRHGSVFNESPFIITNFSIDYPTDKGYEYRTLMPRQIKFSLSLEEFHQTNGSHHGTVNEVVPGASQIVDLVIKTANPTIPVSNRRRGLGQ